MSKSHLIALAVLIGVAGGGYYLVSQNGAGSDSSAAVVKIPVATVTLTDGTGFSPATIQTRAGGVVRFINQSTGKMWVASDPYPSRTNYPSFDQGAGVTDAAKYEEKSTTYEFTFTKAGSYGYHDQLQPRYKGAVVVTE